MSIPPHEKSGDENEGRASQDTSVNTTCIPIKTYFILAIPAIFDLTTTALCMIGLVYLDVSIYQLLRGSGIIFTALIRTWALHQPLYRFQWLGVLLNVMSVVLVGITALLNTGSSPGDASLRQVLFAIGVMLLGTLVQSMQFGE
jgi:drug/metabolite transporter (DMT)-like permease